jgi:archaellum biogenesis ATPase FlaH
MALATLERVRINPIAIFKPLEWQIEPWLYKGPVMLLTGGAGGGKSRIASEKLHGFCKKYPKAQALVIRNTRRSST